MRKNKIAVLFLCSGTYAVFWEKFHSNFVKNFLCDSEVHYYVFTDADNINSENDPFVHVCRIKSEGWPMASLKRYHFFMEYEDELRTYDYCFFMNACMLCVNVISEKELLKDKNKIIVVEHPGYMNNRMILGRAEANRIAPFERNVYSKAYVPFGKEKVYVIGAINGGGSNAFMDMVKVIKEDIDSDLKNNIMAVVYDESYLNSYINKNSDYCLLGSEYCYPEMIRLPICRRIMIMEKVNVLDVYSIKYGDSGEINKLKGRVVNERKKKNSLQKIALAQNHGITIDKILNERHCKNVAIFGYRDMGKFVCELLNETGIYIKYIIDNEVSVISLDINLIKEGEIEKMEEVDCIILTIPQLYYNYSGITVGKEMIPVYSFEELAHAAYMRSLGLA